MNTPDPRCDFDSATAERLLCLDDAAVTPELGPLARVLRAVAAATDPDDSMGEERALAAFRAAMAERVRRPVATPRQARMPRTRKVAAVVAACLVMTSAAAAAAATGYLPEPAQRTARELLEHVGIDLPGPIDSPDGRRSTPEPGEPAGDGLPYQDLDDKGPPPPSVESNGPGRGRGAEVSEVASGGRSHAGENGGTSENGGPKGNRDHRSNPQANRPHR